MQLQTNYYATYADLVTALLYISVLLNDAGYSVICVVYVVLHIVCLLRSLLIATDCPPMFVLVATFSLGCEFVICLNYPVRHSTSSRSGVSVVVRGFSVVVCVFPWSLSGIVLKSIYSPR
jgi:hypothetical protein